MNLPRHYTFSPELAEGRLSALCQVERRISKSSVLTVFVVTQTDWGTVK